MSHADRVFVALDVPNAAEAEALADALAPLGVGLKMGLELFSAEGPALARRLAARSPLFLDMVTGETLRAGELHSLRAEARTALGDPEGAAADREPSGD